MARPRIEIDKKNFEKLCAMLCTEEEIADFFNASVDTLQRWCKITYKKGFKDIYRVKASLGKIALRRYQMQLAERHPNMAIFLGKQYLGQRDVSVDGGGEKEKKDGSELKIVVEERVIDLSKEKKYGEDDKL